MRILITTGIFAPEVGGPASYCLELAKRMASEHEVAVLTYSSVRNHESDKELPFPVFRIWKGFPKGLRHLMYLFKVRRLAVRYDVIYALNAVSAGLPALWAAKSGKKRFFVKIVGDYAWETAMNRGETYYLINDFQKVKHGGWIGLLHRCQRYVCVNADKVIVPSRYLAGLVEGWGVAKDSIEVVYNGVDFKAADVTKEEARKQIGISGNLILSVGRLVPWKGFRMLIKIMPQLLQINQFFRLVIVGDGPELRKLSVMTKNLGLERKVFFVGKKTHRELALYMAAADMFVLNTGYEGFSHQILEAMAAGVPIITTPVGGNREVIEQSENGFMVKYNDEFNLVEAIRSLWEMAEVREKFVEEGKKTVRRFTVENMFKETIEILTEAISPKS